MQTIKKSKKAPAASKATVQSEGTPVATEPRTLHKIVTYEIVVATIRIPAAIFDIMTPDSDGLYTIPAASIDSDSIDYRAAQWNRPYRTGRSSCGPSCKTLLGKMKLDMEKGPAVSIDVRLGVEQWECIQIVARRLRVTPGDWLLSRVGYLEHNHQENQQREPRARFAPLVII